MTARLSFHLPSKDFHIMLTIQKTETFLKTTSVVARRLVSIMGTPLASIASAPLWTASNMKTVKVLKLKLDKKSLNF